MDTDTGHRLEELLAHLAGAAETADPPAPDAWHWQGWHIRPVSGGMNNRLLRATGPAGDFAIKFTIRDERDRAGREWTALSLLAQAAPGLAPRPVLLDRHSHPQPVIVQEWLAGHAAATAPANAAEWTRLCRHLLAIHQAEIPPEHPAVRPVVLYVTSPQQALDAVRMQHNCLPAADWPGPVPALLAQAEAIDWPGWPPPRLCFCRADPNIRNFIRRPGAWASVDWEYSGWGDPAFEIADLLTHAAHIDWPEAQRRQLAEAYCAASPDPAIAARVAERMAAYEPLMLLWWTLRLGRYLHEVRSGQDRRLVTFSDEWLAQRQAQQQRYAQLAQAALAAYAGD